MDVGFLQFEILCLYRSTTLWRQKIFLYGDIVLQIAENDFGLYQRDQSSLVIFPGQSHDYLLCVYDKPASAAGCHPKLKC